MAQVITTAGEQLFAIKAQNNQPLDIDTFIFAYVPGQDSSAAIDRNEGLPPVGQRVHQQIVQQRGRVNSNVVIYSTVLDSVTGPFEFNWVGLYSSVNNTLVAISKIPTVVKTVTVPGTAGNILNRNFGIEYSGIADLDGITVDPETWQLDYTARLNGMDELTRQLAADMNGRDWFIDNGFKVAPLPTPNNFKVTAGAGYVSGLRIAIEEEPTLIAASYPQFVYVNAWFDGTSEATWKGQTTFQITPAEQEDYTDETGKRHYLFKLATITAADTVIDHRSGRATSPHPGIKYLLKVPGIKQTTLSFHTGLGVGAGEYIWLPDADQSQHLKRGPNGGILWAANAMDLFDGTPKTLPALLNWAGSGYGCWEQASLSNDVKHYGATGTNPISDTLALIKCSKSGTVELKNIYISIEEQTELENSVDIISPSFDGGLIMSYETTEPVHLISLNSGECRFYGVDFQCEKNNFEFNSWFYLNGASHLSFHNCSGNSSSEFDPRLVQIGDMDVESIKVAACDFKKINQIWRSNGSLAVVKSMSILGNEWSDTYGVISLNSPFGFSENTIFNGNTIKNVTDPIQSDGGDYINISDNVFDKCERIYWAEQMAKRVTITGNIANDVGEVFVRGWSESGNLIINSNTITGKIYRYKFNDLTSSIIPWDISLYGNIRVSAIGPVNSGVQQFPLKLGTDYTIASNTISLINPTYQNDYSIFVEQEKRSNVAIDIAGYDGWLGGLQGVIVTNNTIDCFIDAVIVGISTFVHRVDGNSILNCDYFLNFYDADDNGRRFSIYGTNTLRNVTQAVRGNQQSVIDGSLIFDGYGVPNVGFITGEDLVITKGYSFKLNYQTASAGLNLIELMANVPMVFNGEISAIVKSYPNDALKAFSHVVARVDISNNQLNYSRLSDIVKGDLRRRIENPVFTISGGKVYYSSYSNTPGKDLSYEFKIIGEIYIENDSGILSKSYSGDGVTEVFSSVLDEDLPDNVMKIEFSVPSTADFTVNIKLPQPAARKSVTVFTESSTQFINVLAKSAGQTVKLEGLSHLGVSANQNKGYCKFLGIDSTTWVVESHYPDWVGLD